MSGVLTIGVVRGWRPSALTDAATGVETARSQVEEQVRAAKAAMATLAERWQGDAAQAAAERMSREATTGFELADALAAAREALRAGGTDLGTARDAVLTVVGSAQSAGFAVDDSGQVTAPTLPPVLTAPDDPTGAVARRNTEQRALNGQAAEHAELIAGALTMVATIDGEVAGALSAVPVPQSLESAVDAYLQRALDSRDIAGALGAVGVGGVALAQVIKKFVGSATKGSAYLRYLRSAFAPITDYPAMLASFAATDEALDLLKNGAENGGVLRFVLGSRAARLAGKAFPPATVLTGGIDAVTGGGYDGARGWATRGFGLGGAAGAGALLAATALVQRRRPRRGRLGRRVERDHRRGLGRHRLGGRAGRRRRAVRARRGRVVAGQGFGRTERALVRCPVSIATPEGADLTALPVEVLTDEELAILAGPGGLVVAPYLGSLDDADREVVLRTAYRGLLARGVVNPPSPRALAAAVDEPSVELQVRRDVLSLVTLRQAARVVVAIGRTTVATQDYWYAHVVDDVVVVEQVGSDGLHRFALARTDQLADLVIGAAVHPECGDSAGLALELSGDASEPPLEVAQALGAALLRTDVVVRHAADRNPPLIGLFTGPGGAWMVRAQESAGGPLLARPLARVELEHELRVAVHDAVAAVGSTKTRS